MLVSYFFNFKSCLAQMLPKQGIRFAHHLRIVDNQTGETNGGWRKRHCHTVIVIGGDMRGDFCGGGFEVPTDGIVALNFHHIAQLAQFCAQCLQAVGFFDAQRAQSCDAEGAAHQTQHHHEGLRNVGGAAQIGECGATAAHAAIASQIEIASAPVSVMRDCGTMACIAHQ